MVAAGPRAAAGGTGGRAPAARLRHRCMDLAQRPAAQLAARHRTDAGGPSVVRHLGRAGALQRTGLHRVRPQYAPGPARQRHRRTVRRPPGRAVDQRFARQRQPPRQRRPMAGLGAPGRYTAGADPVHADGQPGPAVAAVRRQGHRLPDAGCRHRLPGTGGGPADGDELHQAGGRCTGPGMGRHARRAGAARQRRRAQARARRVGAGRRQRPVVAVPGTGWRAVDRRRRAPVPGGGRPAGAGAPPAGPAARPGAAPRAA